MSAHPTSGSESWAGHAETHVSAVFFAGDHAFKILKPLTTAFLDHGDLAKRKAGAELEVELNRRLAPDVYLGVTELGDDTGVIDYAIVMKRMPDDRRLSTLLDAPDFNDKLRAVARKVATFHASLPSDDEAVAIAGIAAERKRWQDNVSEMRALAPEVDIDPVLLSHVEHGAEQYLSEREPLFAARAAAGLCRDGHGDLLADDIFCLEDGPRILDCLAFSTDFRKGDVLADIAFLVMDIERLAGARAAQRLLRWYQEFSNEHHPASLAHLYVAYRALVRSKVAALRHQQTNDPLDALASSDLLGACIAHLERARPRLVLVGGGPGTGKSTIADAISQVMGWTVMVADELRKDLAGVEHYADQSAAPGEGIYTPAMTADTYGELCARATELLRNGESVILDASWSSAAHRSAARETAQAGGAEIIEMECQLDPAVAKERIVRRQASPWTVSDATPDVVDHLAAAHDAWPESSPIDTSQPFTRSRAQAIRIVLDLPERSDDKVAFDASMYRQPAGTPVQQED